MNALEHFSDPLTIKLDLDPGRPLTVGLLILALWIFTTIAFWPSNHALFVAASAPPSTAEGHAELIRQAHQWMVFDWCRVAMTLCGFICAVPAIRTSSRDLSEDLTVR